MKKILVCLLVLISLVGVSSAFNYTIDGTGYNFGQQFNATSGAGTGVLTDYQIRVNLSTTVSPSTATTLYTNGSTRSDWNDIQFTDSSDNPLPFWIENSTYTASAATAWVRTPVSPAGTTVRMYYGNSTKATSEIDGLNTFPLWDDFNKDGTSFNVSRWVNNGCSANPSSGIASCVGANTNREVYQNTSSTPYFPFTNTSIMFRASIPTVNSDGYLRYYNMTTGNSISTKQMGTQYLYSMSGGSTTSTNTGVARSGYYINELFKSGSNAYLKVGGSTYTASSNVPTDTAGAFFSIYTSGYSTLVDWVFVRHARATEPTLSGFMDVPAGGSSPTAAFSGTPLTGHAPLSVSFTDASTNTPDSWNWTFGDGGINTTHQNPVYVYTAAGTYDVNLSVGNAFGNSSLVKPGYVIVSNASEVYPAISSNVTSGVYPFAVAFTDNTATYNATVDSWYWQFGDGNTSALQNPEYTYLGAGTFLANLTVTNTSFGATNISASITITSSSATGVNHADMLMSPEYTLTIHVTDSSTGLPIPVVTIMDSDGQTVTTTTGTGVLTEGYGLVTGTLVSEGYYSRAFSVVVDEDMERTYQMTKEGDAPPDRPLYPHETTFTLIDRYGNRLDNVTVTAIITSTTITGNWWETLFGMSSATDPKFNSTLMTGYSDDYGKLAFPMVSSAVYTMTFTDSRLVGGTTTKKITPDQSAFTIVLATTAGEIPLVWGDYINATLYTNDAADPTIYLNLSYNDTSLTTTNIIYYVQYPNYTYVYRVNMPASPSTNQSKVVGYPVQNVRGAAYVWGYYANSTFGNLSKSTGITFNGPDGGLLDLFGTHTGWE